MRSAWRAVAGCLQQAAHPPIPQASQPVLSAIAEQIHSASQPILQPQVCLFSLTQGHAAPGPWHQPTTSQFQPYSSQTQPQNQNQNQKDWREHTRTQFSIRPSLMSPLYSTYLQEIQRNQRRRALANLLDAHMLLANEIDGLDASQVEQTARHRAASLQLLSQDLRSLATRTNSPTCTDRSTMMGFFSLLEQQLSKDQGEGAGAAGTGSGMAWQETGDVDDAQLFYQIAHGQVTVWEAWEQQFAHRYAGTPSLPPLEDIYLAELGKPTPSETAGKQNSLLDVSQAGSLHVSKSGARMDVSGTVLAEGKRKTSLARVLLREGQGRMTVNGVPYDVYFPELAHRAAMLMPLLQMPHLATSFNLEAEVSGGGKSAQAQAVRTALARGLLLFQSKVPAEYRPILRAMAVWDGRQVERKKPGKRKARASFTYVRR